MQIVRQPLSTDQLLLNQIAWIKVIRNSRQNYDSDTVYNAHCNYTICVVIVQGKL